MQKLIESLKQIHGVRNVELCTLTCGYTVTFAFADIEHMQLLFEVIQAFLCNDFRCDLDYSKQDGLHKQISLGYVFNDKYRGGFIVSTLKNESDTGDFRLELRTK
jgi:hypothetical protein